MSKTIKLFYKNKYFYFFVDEEFIIEIILNYIKGLKYEILEDNILDIIKNSKKFYIFDEKNFAGLNNKELFLNFISDKNNFIE